MRVVAPGWFRGIAAVLVASCFGLSAVADSWQQWGGPNRDFSVSSPTLASSWPADGPPSLWSRPLGDGYSSIVSDGTLLFTMYRPGYMSEREIVVALDASTGKTVWEHEYESKLHKPVAEFGHGPYSTPLLSGDRVYAIGTNAVVHCLDKTSGKVRWKRDLVAELSSPLVEGTGYSCSPLAYKKSLIVPLGYRHDNSWKTDSHFSLTGPMPSGDGRNRGIVALSLTDGSVLWESGPYYVGDSSPTLIKHGGQDQILALIFGGLAAINPSTGKELWRLSFEQPGSHIMTPMWDGGDKLFVASGQDRSGGRMIRLTRENGTTVPKEMWYSRKTKAGLSNPVRDGSNIYLASLGFDLKTGNLFWKKRGFKGGSCVLADGKLFILEDDGTLTLATPSPKDLVVHSQFQLVGGANFYACPTLVERTLYIRDRKNIHALDVGVVAD